MSKFLMVLLGTFIGFKSFACIDISGTYKEFNSTDSNIYEFRQKGCESINFKRYDGVSTVPEYQVEWKADGFPIEIIDSQEPDIVYSQRIHFIGNNLVFDITSFDKKSGHFRGHSQGVFSFDPSGRFLNQYYVFYNYNGTVSDNFSYILQKK